MRALALLIIFICSNAFAKFTNETQVSLLSAGGNTQQQAYNAKTNNSFDFTKSGLDSGGHYTYGEANDELSARNWDFSNKYEYKLSEKIGLTTAQVTEGDRFQGIKARYNFDAGVRYHFTKREKRSFYLDLGYRYTIEDRYLPEENQYEHKARAYTQYENKASKTVSYKFWLEYIPNFTISTDYLLTGEASLTSILNSTFSLQVAYKGIYDDLPAVEGNKNYDYQTTTSLVAKFD